MKYIKSVYQMLLPFVGAVCILIPRMVGQYLPWLLGSIMIITGASDLFFTIKEHRYKKKAASVILLIMGICFLLAKEKTVLLMAITWGLLGLQEVNDELEMILKQRDQGKRIFKASIFTCLKLILALALIFEPTEKFYFHIVLLGVEIIIVTIKGNDIKKYFNKIKLKFNQH